MFQNLAARIAEAVNGTLGPIAEFLEQYVWLWPETFPLLAGLLLATGLFVTVRLMFVQVRGFRHAIDITRGKYDDPKDAGDLIHFQALTTALSATVGIGNIAGVAIAIRLGGPGALFWMWLTAFFGMALKYTECTLAVNYRTSTRTARCPAARCTTSRRAGQELEVDGDAVRRVCRDRLVRRRLHEPVQYAGASGARRSSGFPRSDVPALRRHRRDRDHRRDQAHRPGDVDPGAVDGAAVRRGALVILILNFSQIPGGLAPIVTQAFAPSRLSAARSGRS